MEFEEEIEERVLNEGMHALSLFTNSSLTIEVIITYTFATKL